MRNYSLWNKTDSINGVEASHFLNKPPFKNYNGDIILIYAENSNRVAQVECKDILASVYGIDGSLPLDNFMSEYFAKLEPQEEENANE